MQAEWFEIQMNIIVLSIGSNLGDRKALIKQALLMLGLTEIKVSSFYETEPWKSSNAPWFLNIAVMGKTEEPPLDFLKKALETEKQLGRGRAANKERHAPRPIDIDILYYNDAVINLPDLTVPHPRIANRRFVLEPLVEIAPDFSHPALKKTQKELLKECEDMSIVKRATNYE